MNDLLIKLRQQLVSMIEEIDSYKIPHDDVIIIKKEDFKAINYLGKLNSYLHAFEYKNGVKFTLGESSSYPDELETYKKLSDGTLDILILNKRFEAFKSRSGHEINYNLENKIKTNLRNLYNPLEEQSEEDRENQK